VNIFYERQELQYTGYGDIGQEKDVKRAGLW
jgi:hypothetical protein